jgi:hypothetical protein
MSERSARASGRSGTIPHEEVIREHARRGGFPATVVFEVAKKFGAAHRGLDRLNRFVMPGQVE